MYYVCYYCGMPGKTQELSLEDIIERNERVIIASEDWAKRYKDTPETLAKIIKNEAKLAKLMRRYFKDLATKRIDKYINWQLYYRNAITAYQYDVVVDIEELDDELNELSIVMHDTIVSNIALGAAYAEDLYNIDLGLNQYDSAVLQAADKYVGKLVKGINNTTVDRIKQSIKTSTALREDIETASKRLSSILNDSKRATLIARTETVRTYSRGITLFGEKSGATEKVWELSSNPCEICAANEVTVGINDTFPSGDSEPPAHPNCRCSISLIHNYDN